MGEELIIDSYEPYMIGLKFNQNVQLDSTEKKLKNILSNMDFEVAPSVSNMQGPGISVKIGQPIETLGLKYGAELKINRDAHSLMIEGENPENVKRIFEEMPEIFKRIKLEIDDTVVFYEIITNVIVETEKSPREIINKSNKIKLDSLSDLDMYVSGIKINSVDEEGRKLIGLIIEPRAGNPNKFYYANLIFRSPAIDELIEFHKELPNKIIDVLSSLEE